MTALGKPRVDFNGSWRVKDKTLPLETNNAISTIKHDFSLRKPLNNY